MGTPTFKACLNVQGWRPRPLFGVCPKRVWGIGVGALPIFRSLSQTREKDRERHPLLSLRRPPKRLKSQTLLEHEKAPALPRPKGQSMHSAVAAVIRARDSRALQSQTRPASAPSIAAGAATQDWDTKLQRLLRSATISIDDVDPSCAPGGPPPADLVISSRLQEGTSSAHNTYASPDPG